MLKPACAAALVLGLAALSPPTAALAAETTTFPTRAVALAAGQFAYLSLAGGQVTVNVRPQAGGTARVLGSVPAPPAGTAALRSTTPAIAFDGANYVAMVDVRYGRGATRSTSFAVIAGTIGTPPRAVVSCNVAKGPSAVAAVALAGGKGYMVGAPCGAPNGLDVIGPDGTPVSVAPSATTPIAGAGAWLAYTSKDSTQLMSAAGGYEVASLGRPMAPLVVAGDGRAMIDSDLVTPTAALRVPLGGLPTDPVPQAQLLTADRLVSVTDLSDRVYGGGSRDFQNYRIRVDTPAGGAPVSLKTPGMSDPGVLALDANALTVLATSCTGAHEVRVLDLAAPKRAAVSGCPVLFMKRPLETIGRRLTVPLTCPNGCRGDYAITDVPGNVLGRPTRLNLAPGGRKTLRLTLTRRQADTRLVLGRSDSPWLDTGAESFGMPVRVR